MDMETYMDGSILGDIVTYLVFTMAGAEMWQRALAAKDPKSAKKGMFLGTSVFGVTIILVFFIGVVAHQIVGDDVLAQFGSTDATVPALAIKVLPIGLTGLTLYIKNAYNILMFAWSFYAAAAGLPAFAALYWKKATKQGILAGMIAGFVVCVGWKLIGLPFGLGATVPGTIACAIALVCVSLATYKKTPSAYLEA